MGHSSSVITDEFYIHARDDQVDSAMEQYACKADEIPKTPARSSPADSENR